MKIQWSPGDGQFLTGAIVAACVVVLCFLIFQRPWAETACLQVQRPEGLLNICGEVLAPAPPAVPAAAPAPPAPAPPAATSEEPDEG